MLGYSSLIIAPPLTRSFLTNVPTNCHLLDYIPPSVTSSVNFLTGRYQCVGLETGPQPALSPILVSRRAVTSALSYTLFTHNCVTSHLDNIILKFADNTAVIVCITGRDEENNRREVKRLVTWCANLTLNTTRPRR